MPDALPGRVLSQVCDDQLLLEGVPLLTVLLSNMRLCAVLMLLLVLPGFCESADGASQMVPVAVKTHQP
jgi:hypothetical protein